MQRPCSPAYTSSFSLLTNFDPNLLTLFSDFSSFSIQMVGNGTRIYCYFDQTRFSVHFPHVKIVQHIQLPFTPVAGYPHTYMTRIWPHAKVLFLLQMSTASIELMNPSLSVTFTDPSDSIPNVEIWFWNWKFFRMFYCPALLVCINSYLSVRRQTNLRRPGMWAQVSGLFHQNLLRWTQLRAVVFLPDIFSP